MARLHPGPGLGLLFWVPGYTQASALVPCRASKGPWRASFLKSSPEGIFIGFRERVEGGGERERKRERERERERDTS